MAMIAVVIDGGGSEIELIAPMVALLMVAAVDGSGDKCVFTTTSYGNNRHPHPHHPCRRPPSDKDQTGRVEGAP